MINNIYNTMLNVFPIINIYYTFIQSVKYIHEQEFGKTLNIIKSHCAVHLYIIFCNCEGVFIKIRSSQSSLKNVCCTVTKFGNRSGSKPSFCSYQNTLKSVSAQFDLIFIRNVRVFFSWTLT